MVSASWDELIEGERPLHVEMLTAYRELVRSLPDVEERVSRTTLAFARKRSFTSAYVKSGYLEVAVDLLREAAHHHLRTTLHTSKKVITHRLTLSAVSQVASLRDLVIEAADTVGPGTR